MDPDVGFSHCCWIHNRSLLHCPCGCSGDKTHPNNSKYLFIALSSTLSVSRWSGLSPFLPVLRWGQTALFTLQNPHRFSTSITSQRQPVSWDLGKTRRSPTHSITTRALTCAYFTSALPLCYSVERWWTLLTTTLIEMLNRRGHYWPFETPSFIFIIDDLSLL